MDTKSDLSKRLTAVFGPRIEVSDEEAPEIQRVWCRAGTIHTAPTRPGSRKGRRLEVVFSDFTQNAVPEPYRAFVRAAFDEAAP